ncbi:TRAP transporter TatT component family protein [Methylicorpusculum oleiharenae]|uniref:TRAP transporter TatT component family protein n=1 Tax=Methylicorpusculum oleiharenae TaxID=1338687 RepID=UPI001E4B33A0|nr:TRAP transporter TatT component family protein [Methylicorpusculum oleiharenae]
MARSKPMNAAVLLLLMPLLTGCVSSALHDMSDSFAGAILDQEDVAIVREGLPAYLLMTDGLIESNPDNAGLLVSGAKLYAFYASNLVSDNIRSRKLTEKARSYAQRALCLKQAAQCKIDTLAYDDFKPALDNFNQNATNELYTYGLTWSAWLQAHSRDWNAIADRPKIEALFERIIELDEHFDSGRAHYYLGLLRSLLSPALGGKPELAKTHFERAIELSQGKDLAVKVALARNYARMIFDRTLHDNLLHEVLLADPKASGLTLSNTMAQQEAQHLLDESSSYFQE